ncbi:MAG TPA: Na-translocating system protein MpsC family protein [Solirubrobacterales bacterium]|nr:Na-translocating system protein MpsC family protein [Solirubrobacterales bacterium]
MDRPDSVSAPPLPADAVDGARVVPDFDEPGSKLSRDLVDFYKHIYGRGPAAVKTLVSAEVAVTVLYAVFNPGEQTLIAGGKLTEVEQMRLRTAEVARPRLVSLAEEALGRPVVTSVTGIGTREEVATETFFLASDL